jgi:uncharacterized protein with NRDE domain
MCLILVAWRACPGFPLVVAANRDEFHARLAERARFWGDQPGILAGRDLEAGGTWMGISRSGRFAAVTNYRGGRDPGAAESRGALVARFLTRDDAPGTYQASVSAKAQRYSGFNLLVADRNELWWLSNRDGGPRELGPGIYGVGNLLLDTPELAGAKARFAEGLRPVPAVEALFSVLATAMIVAPDYGTRCATVVIRGEDGALRFAERGFDRAGRETETARFDLAPGP